MRGIHLEEVARGVEVDMCSEFLETYEVGIQPTAANLIAPRFGDVGHTKAGQQWANDHHRATQFGATFAVILGAQVAQIYLLCAERVCTLAQTLNLHAEVAQQLNKSQNIHNLGDIVERHLLLGKQCGANDLQSLIFGTLGCNLTTERPSAIDLKICHISILFKSDL